MRSRGVIEAQISRRELSNVTDFYRVFTQVGGWDTAPVSERQL